MKKELPLIALGIIAAAPAFASQQSTSQGFIEDSHLDLFLRNAYIKRDYRDGLPDKAEWGQGIIATFESGFTQGPVGFGVDGIAQYAVRLDGGRGRSGAGGIDFFAQDDDGRAKSDLAKFGATAKMRFSNTVLSYGSQRPMLPIVYADDSRLLYESYTGTMLTSREIDGLEINAGYLIDQQRKSDDSHNSGLKSLTFGGASYQFNDQLSGALYASHVEDVLNKQYLGLNYKQPFAADQQLIVDFNGYNSRLDQEYVDANDTGRSNSIWSLAASYIGIFTPLRSLTSKAAAAPATIMAATRTRAASAMAATPSGWLTPTGQILTARMNVPGRPPMAWILPDWAYRA